MAQFPPCDVVVFDLAQTGGTLSGSHTNQTIVLGGDITASTNLELENCLVRMRKNSKLVVPSGIDLKATGTTFSACPETDPSDPPFFVLKDSPWLGIEVQGTGWVDLQQCTLAFAKTAIKLPSTFNNGNTKLVDSYAFGGSISGSIGIQIGSATNTPLFSPGSFSGNLFETGTGIELTNCPNATVSAINGFKCVIGISANNSKLTVSGANFEGGSIGVLFKNSRGSINGNATFSGTSTAIKAEPSSGAISINNLSMMNCQTGIDVSGGTLLTVGANTMMKNGITGIKTVAAGIVSIGTASGASATIDSYRVGVDAQSCQLTVRRCSLLNIARFGIHAVGSKFVMVRDCPIIDGDIGVWVEGSGNNVSQKILNNTFVCDNPALTSAILFNRSRSSSFTSEKNRIADNTITVTKVKTSEGALIKVKQIGLSFDFFNISNNKITCTSESKLMHGIYVDGDGDNLIIDDNEIIYDAPSTPTNDPIVGSLGIAVIDVDGVGNKITNNLVSSINSGSASVASWIKCAIHVDASADYVVCSNNVSDTYRGLHFGGNLNTCDIAKNHMSTHKAEGMLFDETSSQIQDQNHHENIWEGTDFGSSAALFIGDPLFKFRVFNDPNNQGELPPTFSPDSWFENDPDFDFKSRSSCVSDTDTMPNGLEVSKVDSAIIDGTALFDSPRDEWEQEGQLMQKLAFFPVLRPTGSLAAGFWDANLNLSSGRFALAEKHFIDALTPTTSEQSQMDAIDVQLEQKMAQYLQLDSLENIDTSTTDPQIESQIETLVSQMIVLQNDRLSVTGPLETTILTNLALLDAEIVNLPSISVFESTRKTVLAAEVKNAKGEPFTEADFTTLRNTVNQCLLTAGTAAREAAWWLPWPESVSYSREDYHDQFCFSAFSSSPPSGQKLEQKAKNVLGITAFSVYPNPMTGENLTVDLSGSEFSHGDWQIIDSKGTIIRDGMIAEGIASIKIDMARSPSGVYLIRLTDQNGRQHQQKLVIIR